jgi:hypothetical protein
VKAIIGAAIAIFAVPAPAMGSPAIAGTSAASGCSATSGVTVIVDFTHFAGGKVERGCAPGDPTNGLQALHAAGFASAGTARYGDAFVCRIDGLPTPKLEACADTPPPSAYWAYWYARPSDSAWTYSAVGVLDFDPKPGSIEAFAFGKHAPPSVVPSAAMATTTTTTRPTPTTHAPATTAAPPTTASPPVTAATLPVAPGPTAPPLVEPTTTTTAIKRTVVERPTRKSTTTTAHTRAPASTSTTVGIVERSAAGPLRRHSSGSPVGAVLAIAIVGGLALGAFAFTRARRRRPA